MSRGRNVAVRGGRRVSFLELIERDEESYKGTSVHLHYIFQREKVEIKIWDKKILGKNFGGQRVLAAMVAARLTSTKIRRIHYFSFNNPCSIYMVITKLSDPKLPLSRAVKESTSSRQRIISVRVKEMGQRESFSGMRYSREQEYNELELSTGDGFLIFMMFRSSLNRWRSKWLSFRNLDKVVK